MLRRAENVSVSYKPSFFTGRAFVQIQIGSKHYLTGSKVTKDAFAQAQWQQQTHPVALIMVGERTYWQFQDRYYWDNDNLDPAAVYALLVTKQMRDQRRVDRAVATVAMGAEPRPTQRGHIPDDLKQVIWQRDGGRCRHCGATVELQFDHIIPVSKGGATSEENLQILCGPCNRRKADGLTIR